MLSPAALSIITTAFQGQQRGQGAGSLGRHRGRRRRDRRPSRRHPHPAGDWRLIFFVNLPLAIALASAATKIAPADTRPPQWKSLDLRSAALATLSIGAIVHAITQADHAGWTSAQTLILAGAGIAGLGVFASCERRSEQPLLRIERLCDRAVAGGLTPMLIGPG